MFALHTAEPVYYMKIFGANSYTDVETSKTPMMFPDGEALQVVWRLGTTSYNGYLESVRCKKNGSRIQFPYPKYNRRYPKKECCVVS